jgi:hypothetical protein
LIYPSGDTGIPNIFRRCIELPTEIDDLRTFARYKSLPLLSLPSSLYPLNRRHACSVMTQYALAIPSHEHGRIASAWENRMRIRGSQWSQPPLFRRLLLLLLLVLPFASSSIDVFPSFS